MRTRTLPISTGLSLSLALALLVSLGVPVGAAQIPTNVNTSARPGNEAEDAIAINPTNPSNIVAMSVLPGPVRGTFEAVSFDGGLTWTRQSSAMVISSARSAATSSSRGIPSATCG
jgi:hypothetical protein